jgi:hypothetical protein
VTTNAATGGVDVALSGVSTTTVGAATVIGLVPTDVIDGALDAIGADPLIVGTVTFVTFIIITDGILEIVVFGTITAVGAAVIWSLYVGVVTIVVVGITNTGAVVVVVVAAGITTTGETACTGYTSGGFVGGLIGCTGGTVGCITGCTGGNVGCITGCTGGNVGGLTGLVA